MTIQEDARGQKHTRATFFFCFFFFRMNHVQQRQLSCAHRAVSVILFRINQFIIRHNEEKNRPKLEPNLDPVSVQLKYDSKRIGESENPTIVNE